MAIVGKVDRVEQGNFTLKTTDGKSNDHFSYRPFSVPDRDITITRYEPEAGDVVQPGNTVEVRGLVIGDNKVQYGDMNRFEGEFDKGTYEQMLDYYHGMCNHLCISQEVA